VELLIYNLSHFDSVLLWQQLFRVQIYGLIISMPVQTAQGVQISICAELDNEHFALLSLVYLIVASLSLSLWRVNIPPSDYSRPSLPSGQFQSNYAPSDRS